MIEILVDADSTAGTVQQIQQSLGGTITERWGEHILTVDNGLAVGNIRFITFDWGVSLLEYDITFLEDVCLKMDASKYNPIHFAYCLEGFCKHRFGYQSEAETRTLEQFQSVIITSREGGYNFGYFPKLEKLAINVIQISRQNFLNKRLNNVEQLNRKLYEVFLDTDHQKDYAFYGNYDLKLADKIGALRKVNSKGMIRIMQIQGMVYEILAMHIQDHDKAVNNKRPKTSLLNRELRTVRKVAQMILNDVSKEYSLEMLSLQSGLSQAKLQEGFKVLYARTVTEYIRHVRLEQARDYMNTTDMNISEIVYSIGFSSRSYFSKIFKRKFGISPSEYQDNVLTPMAV